MIIPVLSLWQPYATLVFRRLKKHETRGKPIPDKHVGATIGIHSTAKFPPHFKISEELHELCMDEFGCGYNYSLPCGYILGTARIGASVQMPKASPADDDDRICGDWRDGRFAMALTDVQHFETPIAAKGHQGWWYYDVPHVTIEIPEPPIREIEQPMLDWPATPAR